MDAMAPNKIEPFSLKNAPSLIERIWPAQKISVETKREFDAHGAQTLTPLGSYWKGRKRLVYVRACVLGALLPATDDPERDLDVFEKLMAIDDRAFLARENKLKPSEIARLAIEAGELEQGDLLRYFGVRRIDEPTTDDAIVALKTNSLTWNCGSKEDQDRLRLSAYSRWSYLDKVGKCLRPEELPNSAYDQIWDDVNDHLGTSARSHTQLVEQLGIMRFGHRPVVADTFSGAGSIPFEAARVGCDVYASDLNPIACMLTWGALNLIGGGERFKKQLEAEQERVVDAVDRRISELGVEHDEEGNRAKAYLYCVETKCPITGWTVPLLTSLVISKIRRTIARLVPNHDEKRIDIEVISGATPEELEAAKKGTVQNKALTYVLDGETYRTPIATIRKDGRRASGETGNDLRKWSKNDVVPRSDDILGERLYCIQWITRETLDKGRQETYFATPTEADIKREADVIEYVKMHLQEWQDAGHVPNMEIEAGKETTRLLRERGWTHWHHLFTPRQLLIAALISQEIVKTDDETIRACLSFDRTFVAHNSARLSQWLPGTPGREGRAPSADTVKHVFYNQALNTFFNFGCRSFLMVRPEANYYKSAQVFGDSVVETQPAHQVSRSADIYITDPPYADAVNYHEITEFFIAWLRKNPPGPFSNWVWDSRRPLAIKGDGEGFKHAMIAAYKAMADNMPDNGLQIVMFTHTDASVWAEMAGIFWGAGLQVISAWYVSTEVTSGTKKGGYVQGTVTLVLRKRKAGEVGFKDEIVQEVKVEVSDQIETMTGLNQTLKGHGRIENLFEDSDLQMAGYAAALRVLTRYSVIDGTDMTSEALRPRAKGEKNTVNEIIEFAVQVANEHMVPDGMQSNVWETLTGSERFYLKMLDIEETGLRQLDNYQNFARAFRAAKYEGLMGDLDPNSARLKNAKEFGKAGFEGSEFGSSRTRAALYAIFEIERNVEGDEVLSHLRDLVPNYFEEREHLMAIARYLASKRGKTDEEEARAASILHGLIRNERFG
ncbi:adenine-specific DNA methylase [Rhodoblastus acidophilus]|uniref:anti-phage-associated DUF1156 domain-containing protein n=1 Tax=Rhodoblastus acidophilus TaxID=1074 RepID=UPI0022244CB4|nr:anti-phage-associated DUF1156 domain-containing protein [Rhodoblastus acidophilus]MCW2282579.1 adenine-specific DNA methylase [Rhodoblastus acidophilus]MCW2331440.1 adenine-specific DNA methylase [Rhodoblastus acidophilus]